MGGRCSNRFGLNKVTFSDPSSDNDEHTWLCLEHSNELIDKFLIDIKGLDQQIKTCNDSLNVSKLTPDIGINRDDKILMHRIKDESGKNIRLKEKIRNLNAIRKNALWNLCRFPTCHQSLENKTIYSITIFSALKKDGSGGRMRKSLYLDRKCWILAKGMFGLKQPIHEGQLRLESILN
jgi:hypothetical protein